MMTNESTPTPADVETNAEAAEAARTCGRRRRWGRRMLFGGSAALALAFGGAAFANKAGACGHGGMGMGGHGFGPMGRGGPVDLADAKDMASMMTRRMLREVEATAAQQEKIGAIVQTAVTELHPLREKARSARDKGLELLKAPTLDAKAAETLRAEQSALHDQISKRMTQAMLDAAAVLTPDQRVKLAKVMEDRRGGGRGRGPFGPQQ